ncbi:MAG: hypothetical protein M3Q94_01455 [Pseudomonadota bacterium]|nr:hypothetical protein [Pseudomonadota bacterium]
MTHHRIVKHNDPVPSVPATWMNTPSGSMYNKHGAIILLAPAIGLLYLAVNLINYKGAPYDHHGKLRHFMPVVFGKDQMSSILWEPGCSTINDHGCAEALQQTNGLPPRDPLLRQLVEAADHSMVGSYIPGCWASLRRWQEALQLKHSLVTAREFEWIDHGLNKVNEQLKDIRESIRKSPEAYAGYHQDREKLEALMKEQENIEMTRLRLVALHGQRVTEADVYGSYADQPEWVQENVLRWNAHPENIVKEQLAMLPPAAEDNEAAIAAMTGGHTPGAPFHLDIDSIV